MAKRTILFGAEVLALFIAAVVFARGQTAPIPNLIIQRLGGPGVLLSWSNSAPAILQQSDILGPGTTWRGIDQSPQAAGSQLTVTQTLDLVSGSTRFYRLVAKGSPAAFDYLLAQQNRDGTFGARTGSFFRDTAGIVETFASYGRNDPAYINAVSALTFLAPRNNDDLSRKISALAAAAQDVSGLDVSLRQSQNPQVFDSANSAYPDGGWGLAPRYGSTILDSALAIRALKASGKSIGLAIVNETLAASAISELHGFDEPAGASNLQLLVRKVTGSVRFRITYPDGTSSTADVTHAPALFGFPSAAGHLKLQLQNLLTSASTATAEVGFSTADSFDTFSVSTPLCYLGLTQNPDGGWGIAPGRESHFMITAETLLALAAWKPGFSGNSTFQRGANWLRGFQQPDGGFSSEPGSGAVLDTSLAVLALRASEAGSSLSAPSSFLRHSQAPDGSWGGDAYATALAARALLIPPVLGQIPSQSITSPAPFLVINLDDYVSDQDNTDDQISWNVTGNTSLSVSISNRVATLAYPAHTNLSEQLTFTASDPDGHSVSTNATFTVTYIPPQPPVVTQIPNQNVAEPNPFLPINLDNYVSDPDTLDSQITWTISGNIRLTASVSNRVAFITYPPRTNITEQLTFTARDPEGFSASTTATFSVASNRPPVVSGIPSQTISKPYAFQSVVLDNYVVDPDNTPAQMTWSVLGNTRLSIALNSRVATITYPSNLATNLTEQLRFIATDPAGAASTNSVAFTVRTNGPPLVSPIPGRTNEAPLPFPPITLDSFVSDPDEAATQMVWSVSGNSQFAVSIANRIATITYPSDVTSSFTEQLVFRATDPQGNSGSSTSKFAVIYLPPDYTIPRGGATNDNRTFSTSAQSWNAYTTISTTISNLPPTIGFTNTGFTDVPPVSVRVNYRISAAAGAVPGIYPIRVEYTLQDSGGAQLGPMTNNIYNFRIKVSP